MYAMSWERNVNEYKYESIQDPYYVEYIEDETEKDLSLDELLEKESELLEEMEMEEMF